MDMDDRPPQEKMQELLKRLRPRATGAAAAQDGSQPAAAAASSSGARASSSEAPKGDRASAHKDRSSLLTVSD